MSANVSCLECHHWHVDADTYARMKRFAIGRVSSIRKAEFAACRRFPPVPDPRKPATREEVHAASWPMTGPGDCCGEWKHREVALNNSESEGLAYSEYADAVASTGN